MKILITGGSGQVATAISHTFPKSWKIDRLSHTELDISDKAAVACAMNKFFPDIIINTAAFTAVDQAEKNPDEAFRVNHKAVSVLASLCEVNAIPLIHFSTDYIFDGDKNFPYEEIDIPNPLNVYGLSKWQGEAAVHNLCKAHVILRVSSVFSPYGHNFVKTILRLAKEKEELRVVNDQIHCPTSADTIAKTLEKIILKLSEKAWGTYHYCNAPETTWYEFSEKIRVIANRHQQLKVQKIHPISSQEFSALAVRPRYSVLNCDKIRHFFELTQSNWTDDLEEVVEKILS